MLLITGSAATALRTVPELPSGSGLVEFCRLDPGTRQAGFFGWLFDTSYFPPRWDCGTWTAFEGWLQIVSDVVIFLCYMAIPFALVYFIRRRRDFRLRWLVYLFAIFIVSCGLTHLLSAILFWWPAYNLLGVVKLVTALASFGTVLAIFVEMPRAIKLPSAQMLEAEIEKRERLSAQSETNYRRYQELVEAMADVIWTTDARGRFTKEQQSWSTFTGQDWEAMRDFGWSSVIHEEDKDALLQCWQTAVENKSLYRASGRIWHASTESWHTFIVRAVPRFSTDGEVEEWFGAIIDLSELQRLEKENLTLLSSLKNKNKELEKIIYAASHDLRSPLVNIDGFGKELKISLGELLAEYEQLPERKTSRIKELVEVEIPFCLNHIEASTLHMNTLLDGFLKYSRLGRVAISSEELDMNAVVQKALSSFSYRLQNMPVTINLENLPRCRADETLMTQVFSNLIDNAIKYRDCERPLIVDIKGCSTDDGVAYTVSDNGIGIKSNHQERVFEIFHQLDPSHADGQGLGLALVSLIMHRHGGEIRLASEPGKGSQFSIMLPKLPFEIAF